MKQIKYSFKLISLLLISIFFINYVSALDTIYVGSIVNVEESGEPLVYFCTYNKASIYTMNAYNSASKDSEGYVERVKNYCSTSFRSDTYATRYFMFHHGVLTNYNASSGKLKSAYYDTIEGGVIYYDTKLTTSSMSPNNAKIEYYSLSEYDYTGLSAMNFTLSGGDIKENKYIVRDKIVMTVSSFTSNALDALIETYGMDTLESGIRFSRGFGTNAISHSPQNRYLDTSWKFMSMYVRSTFNQASIGKDNYGDYKPGGSFINSFDNILKFGNDEAKRIVKIIHVDTNGNQIEEFGEQLVTLRPGESVLAKAKSDGTTVNGKSYKYLRGEFSTAATLEFAQRNIDSDKCSTFFTRSKRFYCGQKNDCLVVNLVYGDVGQKRVYVNHIDTTGKKLDDLKRGLDYRAPGKNIYGTYVTIANTPMSSYHETYIANGLANIILSARTGVVTNDEDEYVFLEFRVSQGNSLAAAQRANYEVFASATADIEIEEKYVVVNIVYRPNVTPNVSEIKVIGTLSNINTIDGPIIGSTASPTGTSIVPASIDTFNSRVTPYLYGAYPYILHSLSHTEETYRSSISETIYVKVNGNTIRSFRYTVPYEHTYFQLNNLKMYKIDKMDVYDKTSNQGGQIFNTSGGYDIYTINTSSSYNNKFNSGEVKRYTRKVEITHNRSTTINLTVNLITPISHEDFTRNKYGSTIDYYVRYYGADEDDVLEWYMNFTRYDYNNYVSSINSQNSQKMYNATTRYNTAYKAANYVGLKFKAEATNGYVKIFGKDNMLPKNKRTITKTITKTSNPLEELDCTKGIYSYTSNVMSYMKPSNNLTTYTDFAPRYLRIPESKENGIRVLEGTVYYRLIDNIFNLGPDEFQATAYIYNSESHAYINETNLFKYVPKDIPDVKEINVFTPVVLTKLNFSVNDKVDHTESGSDTIILQKNSEFTITPEIGGAHKYGYNFSSTKNFIKGFYYIFDFDVLYNGSLHAKNSPIYIPGNVGKFVGKTPMYHNFDSAISQYNNSIRVVAITMNITDALQNYIASFGINYIDYSYNKYKSSGANQAGYLTRSDLVGDSYHAAELKITTSNIGRIFDFSVTDCTDLNFKEVFKTVNENKINVPTGDVYSSGRYKWDYTSSEINRMVLRSSRELSRTLPLRPYGDSLYIGAPKIGYRISYDLKTTGYIADANASNSRRVEITPSYYYISKDGKVFDDNITLYSENNNGVYTRFDNSGYTIYYIPDDGYRYLRNSYYTDDYTFLSQKLEPLDVTSTMILTNKSMTTSNDKFFQSWYGEFKLPNSTIAVPSSGNLNNHYEDGYLGVVFDIKCIDKNGFTLVYDTADKSASGTNTSQWDYEGYLNAKAGSSFSGSLKLLDGTWNINNSTYQKIKGTVCLFDLDNRADEDYE